MSLTLPQLEQRRLELCAAIARSNHPTTELGEHLALIDRLIIAAGGPNHLAADRRRYPASMGR